ncbi:MAG: hypothetical protein HC914_10470, partial [Chloroflexaceae bacterium]|nr:hypothetical protein [Chloroflexaceae bacterium]
MQRQRLSALLALCLGLFLGACSTTSQTPSVAGQPAPSALASPTTAPTATPPPTPTPFAFTAGSRVAGLDVGGMDEAAAAAQLAELEQQLMLPLELEAGTVITTLRPLDIGLTLPIDSLLAEARQASETGAAARVALQVDYDTHALQARLDSFAAQLARTTPLNLLTETDTFSRSFVYTPALTINMEQAVQVIERRLASPLAARRVTLELVSDPDRAPEPVPLAQIQPQIEAMAALWDGIVGGVCVRSGDRRDNQLQCGYGLFGC